MSRPTATEPPAVDAGDITPGDFPFRAVGPLESGERTAGFQVVVRREALHAMREHGRTTTQVEVGGVMVGDVYHDQLGPYLLVHAAIAADATRSDAAHVTFTGETWAHIHRTVDERFGDARIVGWYHTHPDFGIFLSEMDLFIQRNFFDQPWQVAFVHDPVRNDEGMFVWRAGQPRREPILVEQPSNAPDGAKQRNSVSEITESAPGALRSATGGGAWFWAAFVSLIALVSAAVAAVEWFGITGSDLQRWMGW